MSWGRGKKKKKKVVQLIVNFFSPKGSYGGGEDVIDVHYRKLKTDIVPLDKKSDRFALIKVCSFVQMMCVGSAISFYKLFFSVFFQEYILNTHAATHSTYSLDLQEVKKKNKQNGSGLLVSRSIFCISQIFFLPPFRCLRFNVRASMTASRHSRSCTIDACCGTGRS